VRLTLAFDAEQVTGPGHVPVASTKVVFDGLGDE
jgi:hypothetical protein